MSDQPPAPDFSSASCPLPHTSSDRILMGHGSGGKMTETLLRSVFLPAFTNRHLDERLDGAVLENGGKRLAFSTDSYVVQPIFFPGGNIGTLAVHGTVNDLAMCAARPKWLSAAFILEEGFPIEKLRRIVESMRQAASESNVTLVTGDTKVVDRGKGDGVYITTSGIGVLEHSFEIGPRQIKEGDAIILSGDIGRHGMAIMACREGLSFETALVSDTTSLWPLIKDLLEAEISIHCLRDLTRGGLATALSDIAEDSQMRLRVDSTLISVQDDVRGACEFLGLDPLFVANEGRFLLITSRADAEKAVNILRKHECGRMASLAGRVEKGNARAVIRSELGIERILEALPGDQLPRIC